MYIYCKKQLLKMLVVLSSIFVYNFAAPFKKDIYETKIETPENFLMDK